MIIRVELKEQLEEIIKELKKYTYNKESLINAELDYLKLTRECIRELL